MLKKLEKFWDFFCKTKTETCLLVVSMIICGIVFCGFMVNLGEWNALWEYPEEEYQVLEAEARRMINSNSFSTEYECISISNNKDNSLKLILINKTATITVERSPNSENEEICIKRESSKKEYILISILLVFIAAFLGGIFAYIAIFMVVYVIYSFCKICYKVTEGIKKAIKKRKNKREKTNTATK